MCLQSLACCFGAAACSLCCAGLPSIKTSTGTGIMYLLFLILVSGICMTMLSSTNVQNGLRTGTFYGHVCENISDDQGCEQILGYYAAYKIMFGMACFFIVMMIITCRIESSKDRRAGIQNGFWLFKFLVLIGMCIGAFWIPNQMTFLKTWVYIGMVGSAIYIALQLLLLIDFAHNWNANWVSGIENNKCWFVALSLSTIFLFVFAIVVYILLIVYYTNDLGCTTNKAFIGINWTISTIISILAITPCIQKVHSESGLLQSAVVAAYVCFLTASAISNNPGDPVMEQYNSTGALYSNGTITCFTGEIGQDTDKFVIAGGLIFVFISRLRTASEQSRICGNRIKPDEPSCCFCCVGGSDNIAAVDEEKGGQTVIDDDEDACTYSYSGFHFIYFLTTLYLMMTLTNWFAPTDERNLQITPMNGSIWAMWVKISSSWVVILIYLCTLLAPACFPDREFPHQIK